MSRQRLAPGIERLVEEPLPVEVFMERVSRPPTEAEVRETAELVRWFKARYPTVRERLEYARRTFARWNRILPRVSPR